MKAKNRLSLFEIEKHLENPFLKEAIREIDGNVVKKYKSCSGYDQRAVLQAIDPKTGEVLGHTTFLRQIEVDEEKFAKLYLANFSAFFELKSSAIKVFGYILQQLIPGNDMILFFIDDCMEYTGYKNKTSIYDGISDLISAGIIARARKDTIYFINPLVVFNGNRVTFAKSYIRKKRVDDTKQLNLFDKKERV